MEEPPWLRRELLQRDPRLERYSGLWRKRRFEHTPAIAPGLADGPLPVFWS